MITALRAFRPLLLVVCRHVFELLAVLVSSFRCYRAGLAIARYDNAPGGGCLVTFLNAELQRLRVDLLVRAHISCCVTCNRIVFSVALAGPFIVYRLTVR